MMERRARIQRRLKFNDPEWGLFGRQTGSPPLIWLCAILFVGMLPVTLLQSWLGDSVWLWAAATFLAMELSVMHAALSHLGKGEGNTPLTKQA